MKVNLDEAKSIVLAATYETLLYDAESETFSYEKVFDRIKSYFSPGFVQRILASLANDGLVTIDQYDENSPRWYTLSDEGFSRAQALPDLVELLRSPIEFEGIPASDRVVALNHNSPAYQDVAQGIQGLSADLSRNNQAGETAEERTRLIKSLDAAIDLWAAYDLKIIQVQVGVIMAIEDAGKALDKVGKAAGWSLLIDLIKKLVKDQTGVDL